MKTNRASSGLNSARTPGRPWENHPQRILVADDDSRLRHINRTVLIRSGYVVDTAEDGAAAWEALDAGCYDLLVTDHNMPRMSGVALLLKLRAARLTLPVILVSGMMPTKELDGRPRLQPTVALPKPFSAEKLLRLVRDVLRAHGAASGRIESPPICLEPPRATPCITAAGLQSRCRVSVRAGMRVGRTIHSGFPLPQVN